MGGGSLPGAPGLARLSPLCTGNPVFEDGKPRRLLCDASWRAHCTGTAGSSSVPALGQPCGPSAALSRAARWVCARPGGPLPSRVTLQREGRA